MAADMKDKIKTNTVIWAMSSATAMTVLTTVLAAGHKFGSAGN